MSNKLFLHINCAQLFSDLDTVDDDHVKAACAVHEQQDWSGPYCRWWHHWTGRESILLPGRGGSQGQDQNDQTNRLVEFSIYSLMYMCYNTSLLIIQKVLGYYCYIYIPQLWYIISCVTRKPLQVTLCPHWTHNPQNLLTIQLTSW